jgi:chromosomal replication initiator protein
MWIAREMTNFSYPALGRVFGGRDHSTVMHGIARADEDTAIWELIEEIFEYVESEL